MKRYNTQIRFLLALSCYPVSDVPMPHLTNLGIRSPQGVSHPEHSRYTGLSAKILSLSHQLFPSTLHFPAGLSFSFALIYPKHRCCKSYNHPIISVVLTSDPQRLCLQSSRCLSDKLMLYGSNYVLSAAPHGNVLRRAAALQPPPPSTSRSQYKKKLDISWLSRRNHLTFLSQRRQRGRLL